MHLYWRQQEITTPQAKEIRTECIYFTMQIVLFMVIFDIILFAMACGAVRRIQRSNSDKILVFYPERMAQCCMGGGEDGSTVAN